MLRPRYNRISRHDQPSEASEPDRLRCSICNFPGVPIDTEPGGGFPTAYTTTGSTYVWGEGTAGAAGAAGGGDFDPTDFDPVDFYTGGTLATEWEAVTALDKSVVPVPNTSVSCPFCGGTRFLDGSRGSGNAIP